MTEQGYIEDISGNKRLPETTTTMVTDVARAQALSASLLLILEYNALGYPAFSTSRSWAVGEICFYDRKLWEFTAAHAEGVAWSGNDVTTADIKTIIETNTTAVDVLRAALLSGEFVVKFAGNLASWQSSDYTVDVAQMAVVGTTGGSESIDSSVQATLLSIVAKTDFSAASLVATGFNWLRFATAVGNGWAIPVPALPYGAINTATAPNGMLFTDEEGENLRPTVYVKPIAEGIPESVTDGTACSYTDEGGYRFYNTAQPCWMVVSGIERSTTCAHIGWSGRYDEYKAVDDASDAGATLALLAAITAMHSNGKMLVVGNSADRIDFSDDAHVVLIVNNDRVQPSWTNILQEDGETYLHTANISDMKSGGMAEFEAASIALTVSGTTVSYSDGNATASTDYVKYVKNVPVRTTYALDTRFAVEDYGGLILQSATGVAEVTIRYAQGIPDNLRALSPKVQAILQMLDDTNVLVERNTYEVPCEAEFDAMPLLGGQPMVLFCAGAPTAENKPTNWIGVEDGGYEWTGLPNVIGQHVRDITNGADYYGWQNPNTLLLEWK